MNNFNELLPLIHRGYRICESKGVKAVFADNLYEKNGIIHGFSTRAGGISPSPFDTLNLGLTRAEPVKNVKRNFKIISDTWGFAYESITAVNYEHGTNILRVGKQECGRGLQREPLPCCDGLITDDSALTLIAFHADCCAVFLYDPIKKTIGLAHAGWRGVLGRIGQKLAEKMTYEFGSNPCDMLAAIGPCICFDCFEVDLSIAETFQKEFQYKAVAKPSKKKQGKAYVDIETALMIQLLEAGIPPSKLSVTGLCTFEREDLFYSYRRDGIDTGAMISFIRLV